MHRSIRLRFASIWLPEYIIKDELENISKQTTIALTSLLEEKAPAAWGRISPEIRPLSGSIQERRVIMASNHNLLVEALADSIGVEEAVSVARDSLFNVGVILGKETRTRLGVGNSVDELVQAARIMYRVLGISFTVRGAEDMEIEIHRCALADRYTEIACRALSATDEGVVRGLNQDVEMRFERRMTAGFPKCTARIHVRGAHA